VNGFNVGLGHALRQGADHVIMFNNDTVVEPDTISRMVETAGKHPKAGVIVPRIYVHDHPEILWSAGSRMRAFPPALVMVKSRGAERPDRAYRTVLDAATYCVAMFPARALREVGLLDASFTFFYEDYDHSLRARRAGYEIVLATDARLYHKVSVTGGAGTNNPAFWRNYGSSAKVLYRKHGHAFPWITGPFNQAYLVLRLLLEGHTYGLRPFLRGLKDGASKPLTPPPAWDDDPGPVEPLAAEPGG
jgi:GT2 family glycosyltransferase